MVSIISGTTFLYGVYERYVCWRSFIIFYRIFAGVIAAIIATGVVVCSGIVSIITGILGTVIGTVSGTIIGIVSTVRSCAWNRFSCCIGIGVRIFVIIIVLFIVIAAAVEMLIAVFGGKTGDIKILCDSRASGSGKKTGFCADTGLFHTGRHIESSRPPGPRGYGS